MNDRGFALILPPDLLDDVHKIRDLTLATEGREIDETTAITEAIKYAVYCLEMASDLGCPGISIPKDPQGNPDEQN